ncbi:MAG: hypothetical protein A2162_05885 [Deltaproteobacteria bacterium RBG_13_52_11b]|nr:MAG: hypothetical protein A2162_05885 [Deltaproteobacteria bacterium RBG_13_52_11b]
MPRIARIVGLGYPHHVVQRGNNKERIFFDKEDYQKYLSLLEKYSAEKEVPILAYCLMANHVHLLLRPLSDSALPKMMQGVTLCYTQYFNAKNERTGRLWECRYYSSIIDEDRYLWSAAKYIENNPVRAGMVRKPDDYGYSSARAHVSGKVDSLLRESLFDKEHLDEYRRLIRGQENKRFLDEIRKQTRLCKPLGDANFLEILSGKIGRPLVFRSKGRPRKGDIV